MTVFITAYLRHTHGMGWWVVLTGTSTVYNNGFYHKYTRNSYWFKRGQFDAGCI